MCYWPFIYLESQILRPLSNWVVFLLLSFKNPLYILDASPFSDIWYANIFFHSVSCLRTLFCLSTNKTFKFWSCPIYFFFCFCAFGVISKKLIPNPRSQKFTPISSSTSFIVPVLTFRFFIRFESVFVYGVRKKSNFIILLVDVCPATICWRDYYYSCLRIPWKTKWPEHKGLILDSQCYSSDCMFILVPAPHCSCVSLQ